MVLKRPALSLFKLATLNVRGLTSNVKRQHLAADIDSYGVDFCSLQELKTTQAFDQVISNGGKSFRQISFGQDSGKHGGLGFVMSPRVEPFLVQHKLLSDRVSLADFKFPRNPNANNKKKILDVRFVAAYGSTSPPAEANQEIRERFYDNLSTAWSTAKRQALFLYAGHFNSTVGAEAAPCVGRYAKSKPNGNGDAVVQWATSRGLLLANEYSIPLLPTLPYDLDWFRE